ncbi:PREDICTED: ninjurin-2-like [Priapulus caudatus]|uniref:Ninjurin-2-like n=1 Tax=Priapulus caudatus TaxID=37621 RepID=A0ABM1E7D7_PRICU|nr:PREDICTED: ninjurin-2-like [Priapulus caudatus]
MIIVPITSNLLFLSPNFNVNSYVTKKTITQGMLDVALLMSNASQLKALLEVGSFYRYYTFMMVLVIASMMLQLAVGVLLLWLSITNINKEKYQAQLDRINDATSVGIFFITIINIFSGVFGIEATKTHAL